jgi:CBS domain-containing protein
MVTTRDLLRIKGDMVWSVPPETTVLDALRLLRDKDIGALLVLQQDQLVGIISERDFVRSIAESGVCMIDTTVETSMTKEVVTVGPDQNLEDCMQLMTNQHIRHLPVLENGRVVGLVSIGDIVKEMIQSKESTINSLENFIEGRGYGQ